MLGLEPLHMAGEDRPPCLRATLKMSQRSKMHCAHARQTAAAEVTANSAAKTL